MVLVTDKIAFIHIYKTGGTTIRETFPLLQENPREIDGPHKGTEVLKGKPEWNLFKFGFVRNPFDWIVAVYYYARRFPNHNYHEFAINHQYPEFLEMMINDDSPQRARTLTSFLEGVDFVGKFEHFETDYNALCIKFGVKLHPIPHKNKGMNDFGGRPRKPYQELHTPKSVKLTLEFFREDFENFDYPKSLYQGEESLYGIR